MAGATGGAGHMYPFVYICTKHMVSALIFSVPFIYFLQLFRHSRRSGLADYQDCYFSCIYIICGAKGQIPN